MSDKKFNEPASPWLKNYGEVKFHLDYPDISISRAVFNTAEKYPDAAALTYMGRKISYSVLKEKIQQAAKAFYAMGIRKGDRVTVMLPNVPQTVACLYGLNAIGAIASMIHPLSAVGEIVFYINEVKSSVLVTIDQFYSKITEVQKQVKISKLLITSAGDELAVVKKLGFKLTQGRKNKVNRSDANLVMWSDFIKAGKKVEWKDCAFDQKGKDGAVILFSGGTTGVTKGIFLSNLNFNALAMQTAAMCNKEIVFKSMLAAMPMFHGFGLGVCIHAMLFNGGYSILVPRFNAQSYAKLLAKEQPNYIAGVPTLYEAITRNAYMDKVSLACLMGVFSGGDSLSIELKKKLDKFLDDHGSKVHVREGYGTTECVTASCLTPYHMEREGSIGFPYPDTYYTICKIGTTESVPFGTEGEICLMGPSVMIGYLNHEKENADTLRVHADGNTWLHTGDLGTMDSDGFIYFKQRYKRMIITSGYNVYPSQIENIIDSHEAVQMSCVIGVKDPYKMQKVKAFVMLRPGYTPDEKLKSELMELCKKNIAKYAMPYDIEFRSELPKTLVGKIAYTVLEKEENAKVI